MVEISCIEKIRGNMNRFTKSEKKIAEYVLSNYEKVMTYNISELADNAKVSDASVVRFCKTVGYKGYQDFKVKVAMDVIPKERHFNPGLDKNDDVETICKKIFSSEISAMNQTLSILNMRDVEKVADLMREAKKIVFFGTGGSLLVGKDSQHKLMKIGLCAFVYEDVDMQLMAASLLEDGDLAFGISHSGSNCHVLNCLKAAEENGAKTVALVSYGRTPISKQADISLYAASEETAFKSESVSTRVVQLAILDSLMSILAFKDYDASYQAIQETRRATSDNKY